MAGESKKGVAKFTMAQVAGIRACPVRNARVAREYADAYKCSPETIRKIWRGDTFRNVGVLEGVPMARTEADAKASLARFLELQEASRPMTMPAEVLARAAALGARVGGESAEAVSPPRMIDNPLDALDEE